MPYVGLLTGATILIACIGGALYLARCGETVISGALLGAPLLGDVGLLVDARLHERVGRGVRRGEGDAR